MFTLILVLAIMLLGASLGYLAGVVTERRNVRANLDALNFQMWCHEMDAREMVHL